MHFNVRLSEKYARFLIISSLACRMEMPTVGFIFNVIEVLYIMYMNDLPYISII
jgi:hypothetical protein